MMPCSRALILPLFLSKEMKWSLWRLVWQLSPWNQKRIILKLLVLSWSRELAKKSQNFPLERNPMQLTTLEIGITYVNPILSQSVLFRISITDWSTLMSLMSEKKTEQSVVLTCSTSAINLMRLEIWFTMSLSIFILATILFSLSTAVLIQNMKLDWISSKKRTLSLRHPVKVLLIKSSSKPLLTTTSSQSSQRLVRLRRCLSLRVKSNLIFMELQPTPWLLLSLVSKMLSANGLLPMKLSLLSKPVLSLLWRKEHAPSPLPTEMNPLLALSLSSIRKLTNLPSLRQKLRSI